MDTPAWIGFCTKCDCLFAKPRSCNCYDEDGEAVAEAPKPAPMGPYIWWPYQPVQPYPYITFVPPPCKVCGRVNCQELHITWTATPATSGAVWVNPNCGSAGVTAAGTVTIYAASS